jgi:hypothetical protein
MILAWRKIPFMLTVKVKVKGKGKRYEKLFMTNTRTFPFQKRHKQYKDVMKG